MASCHYLMCTESVNYETIWKIFRAIFSNDAISLEIGTWYVWHPYSKNKMYVLALPNYVFLQIQSQSFNLFVIFSTFKKGMFFFSCTSTCTNTFRVTKEANLLKSFLIRDLTKNLKYIKFCSVLSISCRNTEDIQCVANEFHIIYH